MKKLVLLTFFALSSFFNPNYAQDYHSRWAIFSDLSPSFPVDKNRVLNDPSHNRSLQWRNKIGMRTFGDLFAGISTSLRFYEQKENAKYGTGGGIYSRTYGYNLSNKLWGMGPFATKLFELSDKFYLTTTVSINLEQGKGRFIVNLIDFDCTACMAAENENSINTGQQEVINRNFREMSLTYSWDVGMFYIINPSMAIHVGANLLRFERYNISTGRTYIDQIPDFEANRDIFLIERGLTTIAQRPVFHLGIVGAIGKK